MTTAEVGVVAIGRNEGERLERCLRSIASAMAPIVYVDSGSTDASVVMAKDLGVIVEELDLRTPFTAARARNAGFARLLRIHPTLKYVFFVDGDCEIADGWLDIAGGFLREHAAVAVVWGRRRERYPQKSVYNMFCDIEWSGYPVGETKACGGDAMIRVAAFEAVGGYRADLICGEEPEMCVRLRHAGWKIWRLENEMTLHDAAMYRFGQWWQRMVRGGYGMAQGAFLHGAPPERHWVRESRRAWIWGLWIPVVSLLAMGVFGVRGALILVVYPAQFSRLALSGMRSVHDNCWYAASLVVGKFPECIGQLKFSWDRFNHVQSRLIEYK